MDNQDYLINRKNDLTEIKKVTGQLVKISENMGLEVKNQEEILSKFLKEEIKFFCYLCLYLL